MEKPKLLAQRIDDVAAQDPGRKWAEVLLSVSPLSSVVVDYSLLSSILARLSRLIETAVGPRLPASDQLTLWYSGPSDIRYPLFMIACSKIGHKALFISPRNSSTAHSRLLDATSCNHAFTSNPSWAKKVVGDRELTIHEFPEVVELLETSRDASPAPNPNLESAADDVFVILHTSGSTNHPKPISLTNRGVALYDNWAHIPPWNGERLQDVQFKPGQRMYLAFPLFHKAGCDIVHQSFSFGFSLVFGPTDKPPSATILASVLKADVADCGGVPTSVLQDLASNKNDLPLLAKWRHVGTGGAPFAQASGDAISKYTILRDILGSTETSAFPELLADKAPGDWMYHFYHPSLNISFEPHSDDSFEAVIRKTEISSPLQLVFSVYPNLKEYQTGDLYRKHPTKDHLWKYHGRADNIIILSNGEKIAPDEVESVLSEREDTHWALVVGAGRFEPALLIAPGQQYGLDHFTRTVREDIAKTASRLLPAHADIGPDHVWVLNEADYLEVPKSGKGKPQRRPALDALKSVIDEFYTQDDRGAFNNGVGLDFSDDSALARSLETVLSFACPKVKLQRRDDDFFSHGMDSLQAIRFIRALKPSLEDLKAFSVQELSVQFIYANPTVRKLAQALVSTSDQKPILPQHELDIVDVEQITSKMKDQITMHRLVKTRTRPNVILTGSTGSLGCYILASLMGSPNVGTIYCLNRHEARETMLRQKDLHLAKGLQHNFVDRKVVFLQSYLHEDHLGLESNIYFNLVRTVSFIIHNAWFINWSAPLSAFKPLLQGCVNLVTFAQLASQPPEIIFASSVGAMGSWLEVTKHSKTNVPEQRMEDFRMAEPTAYSRSKLAAEHIFAHASTSLGIPVTICRIGQIAGPVRHIGGGWKNQDEWFPSLMHASRSIGLIPADFGCLDSLDWIPVDVLADVITGLIETRRVQGATQKSKLFNLGSRLQQIFSCAKPSLERSATGDDRILHLVHPKPIRWSTDGVPAALRALAERKPAVVSLSAWIAEFKKSIEEDEKLAESPTARLLDFYVGLADPTKPQRRYATTNSCKECPELASAPQIQPSQLERWMRAWFE